MLIFAAVSLLSGLATLALPETKGGTLPDSVEEGEGRNIPCVEITHSLFVLMGTISYFFSFAICAGEEYGKVQKICDCRLTVKDSEGTAI